MSSLCCPPCPSTPQDAPGLGLAGLLLPLGQGASWEALEGSAPVCSRLWTRAPRVALPCLQLWSGLPGTPATCAQCPASSLSPDKDSWELLGPSSYWVSSAHAGTQTRREAGKPPASGFISQAAMILTLLWVKGRKPEKKSVYHVGNSCHP